MLSFIIPTRNRPEELGRTLARLGRLPPAMAPPGSEVIVIDNASARRTPMDGTLENGMPVRAIRLHENRGAAARNMGAALAANPWLVMLDDDSAPIAGDFAGVLAASDADIAAVGGDIRLPSGNREAGGLPEVIVGCGCAIRRDAFLAAGGYDEAFGYYAEEYDLCARFIGAGHRVAHTAALRFEHRKVTAGRDFAEIMYRLVRNNGWTIRRHAPEHRREAELERMLGRYRSIAKREGVVGAFDRGERVIADDPAGDYHRRLTDAQWSRFTGRAAVEQALLWALRLQRVDGVELVSRGKGVDVIEAVLTEANISIETGAETEVIASLSPGPLLDASARHPRAFPPWRPDLAGTGANSVAFGPRAANGEGTGCAAA